MIKMSRVKRKKETTDEGRKDRLAKKWKKIGGEVLQLSADVAWEEYRRRKGLEALEEMGIMNGEIMEERSKGEEEKRSRCIDMGRKVSHMVVIRNMETDWKEAGWMHWKKAFATSFINELFLEEVECFMSSAVEEERGAMKQKSKRYGVGEVNEGNIVLGGLPIHDMVMRKIMDELVVGDAVIRETMFAVTERRDGEDSGWVCTSVLSNKAMRDLWLNNRARQEEPVAVVIPLVGSLTMETHQQYKKHVGRPRRGKKHDVGVGDMFMLNWNQLHSITCNVDSVSKEAKWIIVAAARIEKELMY
jgi:hypothetical protein